MLRGKAALRAEGHYVEGRYAEGRYAEGPSRRRRALRERSERPSASAASSPPREARPYCASSIGSAVTTDAMIAMSEAIRQTAAITM